LTIDKQCLKLFPVENIHGKSLRYKLYQL